MTHDLLFAAACLAVAWWLLRAEIADWLGRRK